MSELKDNSIKNSYASLSTKLCLGLYFYIPYDILIQLNFTIPIIIVHKIRIKYLEYKVA